MKYLKRLLVFGAILAMAMVSRAQMTVAEMEAWVGADNVTSNDILFANCMKPIKINGGEHQLGFYGSLEILDVYLTQLIPTDMLSVRWGVISEDPVTLSEFLLLAPYDLDGPTCIVMLTAHDFGGSRKSYTSSWHAGMWLQGVAPFGYTVDDFLSTDQASNLKPQSGE